MKTFRSHICYIAVLLMSTLALGQESETDFQTWMDFRTIYDLNEKWTYDGNYGLRGFISAEDWRRTYLHPSITYYHRINLRFRGGIRFIFTEEFTDVNTFEIRPWQGVSLNWPRTSYFTINNYLRLEERFTFTNDDRGTDFALRMRYRIQAKTPTITINAINQRMYFLANFELFFDIGQAVEEKFANRRRLSLGAGFYITKAWWFELIYVGQGSRRNMEDGVSSRENVLRFRLRWKIN